MDMAFKKFMYVRSAILIIILLQMAYAQNFAPKNTGQRCISMDDCKNLPDGLYQWCESCNFMVSCWVKTTTIKGYIGSSNPYWDDNRRGWVNSSSTCVEWYKPCPPAPPQPVCESTGMGCLKDLTECANQQTGYDSFYQFCGNCSTYIHCDLYQYYKYYKCASGTYFDAIQRKCLPVSKTCVECYQSCSTPTPEPTTIPATSPATTQPCPTPPEKECTCGCSCSSKCE